MDHDYCSGCGNNIAIDVKPPPRYRSSYTPRHLTENIFTSTGALEGERKDVTVLFADVKGSMELAEGVDVEDWHAILDRFFTILNEGVHRYDGTVNQYTGDGIMALFGAPVGYENHPQRACHSALYLARQLRVYSQELRRRFGLDFVVRIGLSSGEVVVGRIGDNLREDYTAQGYTVGLASRIMTVAEAGKIYLTSRTAARVGGYFELEDLGEFRIKGVRETVRVYALEGLGPARTRYDISRSRGLGLFVDREAEMAKLERALRDVKAGRGRIVGVRGSPGVGKSRLCDELTERACARGFSVYRARALPHGRSLEWQPIQELFRSYFRIEDGESAESARAKVDAEVRRARGITPEVRGQIHELLGLGERPSTDPDRWPAPGQRIALEALVHAIEFAAVENPSVLWIEDLHWLDRASEACLDLLIAASERAPLLLLLTFRPELRGRFTKRPHYREIEVGVLPEDAARSLVLDRLGDHPGWDGATVTALVERSGSNPLFLEELVRALRQSPDPEIPVAKLRLSSTTQSLVVARIDRLSPRDKSVLLGAAIVGQSFEVAWVARVVELPEREFAAALAVLEEAGFVRRIDEESCRFEHPILQEVAYRIQLGPRRERAHRVLAEVLERDGHGHPAERARLLAHHWELANDFRRGAQWHARAARALRVSSPESAAGHWKQVRALLHRIDESREGALLELEGCRELLDLALEIDLPSEELASTFAEGRALAENLGDVEAISALDRAYAMSSLIDGSFDESTRWLDEAIQLESTATEPVPDERRIQLRKIRVLANMFAGRLDPALAEIEALAALDGEDVESADLRIERAPAAVDHIGDAILGASPYSWRTFSKGSVLVRRGQLDEAEAVFDRAVALARDCDDQIVLAHSYHALSLLEYHRGDAERARTWAERGISAFESMGKCAEAAYGHLRLGAAQVLEGEFLDAVKSLQIALDEVRERRVFASRAQLLAHLSRAHVGLGDRSRALVLAEEAVRTARRRAARVYEIEAQLALACALRHVPGPLSKARIEVALARSSRLVEDTGARVYEPFVAIERGKLAALLGDDGRHERETSDAYRLFNEMGAIGQAKRLIADLG